MVGNMTGNAVGNRRERRAARKLPKGIPDRSEWEATGLQEQVTAYLKSEPGAGRAKRQP